MSNNSKFEDVIDNINNIAQGYGFINGIDWARNAQQAGDLTFSDFKKYENAHHLRVRFSHGSAKDIAISDETLSFAYYIEKKINTSKVKKGLSKNKNVDSNRQVDSNFKTNFSQNTNNYVDTTSLHRQQTRKSTYQFVSDPPKSIFGKVPAGYVWVICDHVGAFLAGRTTLVWTPYFEQAILFETERDAKKTIKFFKENYFRHKVCYIPRCVKIF